MKSWVYRLVQQFVLRWYWIQQLLVTSLAAAVAWSIGDRFFTNGGIAAAVVASLTVRSSLQTSTRNGLGQIVGSSVGAGAALISLHYFGSGIVTVGITVLISMIAARFLHLGDVASINVPVTALIVLGPGLSETTAVNRLISTLIGAVVAILFSAIAYPKSPASKSIERTSSLTDRCAVLLAQMAEGFVDDFTIDDSGRWLARARLLSEEIPTLRNEVIEAQVFAKFLPATRTVNAEKIYLRTIAVEHIIVQTRSTARILYDIKLNGGVSAKLSRAIGELLATTSYALTVRAEDFRIDPYSNAKDPLTSEVRLSADSLTHLALVDHENMDGGQLARILAAVSNTIIIADSLDQISPAIRNVPTPLRSASQKVLAVSALEQARTWQNRLYRLIPLRVRNFKDRVFH